MLVNLYAFELLSTCQLVEHKKIELAKIWTWLFNLVTFGLLRLIQAGTS
jgi:hypothetical protein